MSESEVSVKPAKKASLKVNLIYNFISKILVLIIPLITTPYLARVLHEEGNGQISFATSIITYFILFANIGFDIYGQREIAKLQDDKEQKSIVFWEIICVKAIFTSLSIATLLILVFTVGFGSYTNLIFVMSIQVVACVFDIQFYYQGEENFRAIALRTILLKIIGLVCIFVFVKDEDDTWIYALCYSLSMIVSNFVMWPSAIKRLGLVNPKRLHIWRHIAPAMLIFLPTLAVTVYSVFDKTMIGLLAANADYENGCYEQAYKINSIALLIVTIVPYVLVPRNAYDYGNGNIEDMQNHVYFAFNYVWLMGVPLIAGFAALSENLSSWFLGDGYEAVPLLMKVMSVRFISSGFGVILGDSMFIVMGKEKYVIISSIVAACLNVGLNALMIPSLGAVGAAVATAIAEGGICLVLFIFAICKKVISVKKVLLMGWKYLISAGIMFVALYFLQKVMPYAVWSFIVLVLTGCVVYGCCLLILRDKFLIENVKKYWSQLKNKFKKKNQEENSNV